MSKACQKCGRTRHLALFARDRSRADGRSSHCKECKSKANSDYVKYRISDNARVARESYRKALYQLARLREREYRQAYLEQLARLPAPRDQRGYRGRGESWPAEERWPDWPDTGRKKCRRCEEIKPDTVEFWHRNSAARTGLDYYCKSCRRVWTKPAGGRPSDRRSSRAASAARLAVKRQHPREFEAIREAIRTKLITEQAESRRPDVADGRHAPRRR